MEVAEGSELNLEDIGHRARTFIGVVMNGVGNICCDGHEQFTAVSDLPLVKGQ